MQADLFAFLRECVAERARLAGLETKSVLQATTDQEIEVQAAEALALASYALCKVCVSMWGSVLLRKSRVARPKGQIFFGLAPKRRSRGVF